MVSVEEVWKAVLPSETRLAGGAGGLGRQVSWALVLKPRPPGLDAPRGDEIILLSTAVLSALDPHLTLVKAIQSLAGRASALAVRGDIGAEDAQEAERLDLPLFELPASVSLSTLERDTLHFLSEQRSVWYQRKHAILQELTALAVHGRGLEAIARHMAQVCGHAVTFEDEGGAVLTSFVPSTFPRQYAELLSSSADGTGGGPTRLDGQPVAVHDGLVRLTIPVSVKDGHAGSVSLYGPKDGLDPLVRLVLEAGATAGAVELAREHAVLETVHRFQGDLIGDLVAGTGDRVELERRARRMDLDLDAPRIAIAFSVVPGDAGDSPPPVEALEALRRRLTRVLTTYDVQGSSLSPGASPSHVEDELLILFYPAHEDLSPAAARRLAERLHRDLADAVPRCRLYAGISRVHSGPGRFPTAFHEARRAVELGHVLAPERGVTHFAELGLHRLLFAMRETSEMQEFYDDMLGQLARYDEDKGSELVATLDAYLCAHNATEVAAQLNLHRNSLLYRLRRIQEITGLDLDDPETRLALHLACRIGEALRARTALGA